MLDNALNPERDAPSTASLNVRPRHRQLRTAQFASFSILAIVSNSTLRTYAQSDEHESG